MLYTFLESDKIRKVTFALQNWVESSQAAVVRF